MAANNASPYRVFKTHNRAWSQRASCRTVSRIEVAYSGGNWKKAKQTDGRYMHISIEACHVRTREMSHSKSSR